MKVHLKKIDNTIKDLEYAHDGDAGLDLYANEESTLEPHEIKAIGTGLKISFEKGYEAQVRPKSGLALNHGLTVLNTPGTIDSNYRGEIKVILINLGKQPYKIEKGKKIAQLIFNKVEHPHIEIVEDLDDTNRGEGGFGSTGLH